VYAADAAGKVYCIGPDGRRRWAIRLPAPTATPVPGPDGTVYVAVSDGKLYAVSPPPGGA
jgi:outer membrane protein assembly factor BamB